MVLSVVDVKALSDLLDESESVDTHRREAWLAALPKTRQRLVPALRTMWASCTSGAAAWSLPTLGLDVDALCTSGAQIGPYRLIRQIGDGGMGSVWLAERADGSFDRRVALKLPRMQDMPRGLAERMSRERHIAARLEHPHIARLYDAGLDAAQRPYIAFEYVAGQQIDQWCRAPGRHISDVLRSFVQVIRAVAYAHRQLVVHRDLKPANILVDANGQAFLLDFGIAKLLEEVVAQGVNVTSEYGSAMTRHYASPEQIAGLAVGTASDIYSLGVTLYEILTHHAPYVVAGDTARDLETAILRGDIVPASQRAKEPSLQRALRGDLDAILWKAMQCKPEQRYPNAEAMADDVERHLAGQPVSVRYLPWFERGRRFAARHRAGMLVTAVVSVSAGLALAALVHQVHRTTAEAERASMVTEFTAGLFRLQARPLAATPNSTPASLSAFAPVAALIDTRFAERPDVQAELYGAIAGVYIDMGVGKLAAAAAERHLGVLKQNHGTADQLAKAFMLLATANRLQGRYANAEQDARRAVAALAHAKNEANGGAGLEAHALLAGLLMPNGRIEEARQIFLTVEKSQPLNTRPATAALAKFMDGQGTLLEIDNRFDEAVLRWQKAVAVAIAAEGAHSTTAAHIRIRMGAEELARNRLADARQNLDLAISALNSSGDSGQIRAAVAVSDFAASAFSMGLMPPAQAESLIAGARGTVAAWGAALPAQVLANIDVRRGVIALRQQNLVLATDLLERAVPIARDATDGLIHQRGLAAYLGTLAMATGQHERADALLRQRRELRVRSGDGATPFAAYDWVLLSHNLLMKGDVDAAQRVLIDAPVFTRLAGDTRANGMVYANAITEQWARIWLARDSPTQALAAMPPPYGLEASEDRSEPTLAPHALRGEVLCAAGQHRQGLPHLLASIEAVEPVLHASSPGLARLRAVAGRCALQAGDRSKAVELAGKARAAFDQQPLVSAWYKAPLDGLERALSGRRRTALAMSGLQAPKPSVD
jgi:eukaryotic-like serine/threonine-protein kinase